MVFKNLKCHSIYGGVAQLVRALACHARGRGFKSRHSRHFRRTWIKSICGRLHQGRLAQLVEHLVYTEGVGSSSLSTPTIFSIRQVTIKCCRDRLEVIYFGYEEITGFPRKKDWRIVSPCAKGSRRLLGFSRGRLGIKTRHEISWNRP